MSTMMKVGHWALNAVLVAACIGCLLLALFGHAGSGATSIANRGMTVITGVAFGVLAFFFIRYTLKKG